MKKALIICFLFLSIIQITNAQLKITGIVIDSFTRKPIEYLSILDVQNSRGTVTNENGEFEILVNNLPVKLLFSHISYKKVLKEVNFEELGEISLPLAVINLPEARTENPALTLLNAALDKSLSDSANRYSCYAYYRNISKEGNNYTLVHEIFFNGLWSQFGVKQWLPTAARYAIKENTTFKFQNLTFAVFHNSGAISKNIYLPTSNRNDKSIFNFKIAKYLNFGTDEEIAEVVCIPRMKEKYYFEGSVFIKTKTNNIVKIDGEMHYPNPAPKRLINPYDKYVINFRESKTGFSILDNFTFNKFVTLKGITDKKIVETSQLIIYDYDASIDTKNMTSAFVKSDIEVIKKTPYNPVFWENNDIIKRSVLEKSVIKSFENSRSFESNFINKK